MSPADPLRLALLLARLTRARCPGLPRPVRRLVAGLSCDVFEPRTQPRGQVVAVHGMTTRGREDDRLQHLGACLAASGVRAVLPTLPGLAGLRLDEDDPAALTAVIRAVAAETGAGVGLLGFCHGASHALIAAASCEGAAVVRFVVAVGAYGSLERLAAHYRSLLADPAVARLDQVVYLRLALAHGRPELAALGTAEREALAALLRDACDPAGAGARLAFFERYLADGELLARPLARDAAVSETLSPAGRLGGLDCPVSLLHDPRDLLVPASESRLLLAELRVGAPQHRHRLVVTRLLGHAELRRAFHPVEAMRLFAALAPLVSATR